MQKDATEQTAVACETHTLDMQCPASQVWTEIERELQRQWVNDTPNREYLNKRPQTDKAQGGTFSGMILEESQPQWADQAVMTKLREAWGQDQGTMLVVMGGLGALLALICAVVSTLWVNELGNADLESVITGIALTLALSVQASAALKGGHFLWSRLYFRSRVTWIEFNGTYQQSQLDVGNTLHGHIRARSSVTRAENATFRIWSSDNHPVTYGKDGARCVVSMSPARGAAQNLAAKVILFAQDQGVLVSPSAPSDQRRMQDLAKLNHQLQPKSIQNNHAQRG